MPALSQSKRGMIGVTRMLANKRRKLNARSEVETLA